MRKPTTLFLAFLITAITMQLGIATHFCGGELAQAKMVYGYGEAGCGMDCKIPSNEPNQQETSFQKPSCCQDFVFTIAVDEYQSASQKLFIEVPKNISPRTNPIFTPVFFVAKTSYTNIPPPYITQVFLPFIQVFLI